MILVDDETRVLVQNMTGRQGSFHTRVMKSYGTKIVAGTSKSQGSSEFDGFPVYISVQDAVKEHEIDASIIFVPARFCKSAVMEAIQARIPLIVIITEGLPVYDEMEFVHAAGKKGLRIIGPNTPGIISPGHSKLGIMPEKYFTEGNIGICSRSGTLTYEVALNLGDHGISTAVGIGGDPITGMTYSEILRLFEQDDKTKAIFLIGEIGGRQEEMAATCIKEEITKPVFAFIAGSSINISGKRFGHAGALISGDFGTATSKKKALQQASAIIVEQPFLAGETITSYFGGQ